MWDALGEVCRRESKNANELCTMINARRNESSLTAAVRVFILAYFMAAATEEGHVNAGHGRCSTTRPRMPARARNPTISRTMRTDEDPGTEDKSR